MSSSSKLIVVGDGNSNYATSTSVTLTTSRDNGRSLIGSSSSSAIYDTNIFENLAIKYQGCHNIQHYWNDNAENDDVKLMTKRLIRYKLCYKDLLHQGMCGLHNNRYDDNDPWCIGEYVIDLSTFLNGYYYSHNNVVNVAVKNHNDGRSNEQSKSLFLKFLECNKFVEVYEEEEDIRQYYVGPYCSSLSESGLESESSSESSIVQFGIFIDNTCTIPVSPNKKQQILHTLIHQQENNDYDNNIWTPLLDYFDYDDNDSNFISSNRKSIITTTIDDGMDSSASNAMLCLPCSNEENGWCQRLYKHSGKCEDSNHHDHDAKVPSSSSSIHDGTSLYTNTNACNYIQGITHDGSSLLLISDSSTTTNHFILLFAMSFILLSIYTRRLRRRVQKEMEEHKYILDDGGGGGYSLVELVDFD